MDLSFHFTYRNIIWKIILEFGHICNFFCITISFVCTCVNSLVFKNFFKRRFEVHLEATNGLVDPGDYGGVVGGRVEHVPDEHVEGRQWHLIGACVNCMLYSVVQCRMRSKWSFLRQGHLRCMLSRTSTLSQTDRRGQWWGCCETWGGRGRGHQVLLRASPRMLHPLQKSVHKVQSPLASSRIILDVVRLQAGVSRGRKLWDQLKGGRIIQRLLLTVLSSSSLQHLEGKVGPQLLDFAQPLWPLQVLWFLFELIFRIVEWLTQVLLLFDGMCSQGLHWWRMN